MLGERIARTDEQLAQTNRVLGEYAESLTDFIRVMTTTWNSGPLQQLDGGRRIGNSAESRQVMTPRVVGRRIDAPGFASDVKSARGFGRWRKKSGVGRLRIRSGCIR